MQTYYGTAAEWGEDWYLPPERVPDPETSWREFERAEEKNWKIIQLRREGIA